MRLAVYSRLLNSTPLNRALAEWRRRLSSIAAQRAGLVTCLVQEGYLGGETRFEASGRAVDGRGGDAVFFAHVDAQGRPDPEKRHSGLTLRQGTNWLATRWIRQFPYDPWSYGKG